MRDRALAEGLTYLESQTAEHGIPAWIAQDPERGTWLEVVDDTVDLAQAALDRWRKANANPEPGTRVFVRDTFNDPPPSDAESPPD